MTPPDARFEQIRYPSGLTALFQSNRSSPVVALQLWVRVGSGDEGPAEAGLAHVHEHMLFKGTPTRPVGAIARDIEAVGGSINAWTSFDQTVYHIVLPSRFAADGLDVLLDAVRNSVFDPTELARELEVIQEEIRRAEDQPSRTLNKLLFESAFTTHPYGRPVIGTATSVAGFTRDDVLAFYRRWYVPSNMVLVVVGDVDRAMVDGAVARYFGEGAAPATPRPARPAEPPQNALRVAIARRDTQDAHVGVAFHVPDLAAAETPAIELLSILLGQGESSILFDRVQRQTGLTQEVYAYLYAPAEPGVLMAGATFRGGDEPEDPLTVLNAVLTEIAGLRHREVSAAALQRALAILESDTIYQRQTVQGVAQRLGYFETVAGSTAFEGRFLELARRTTPGDLRRVAERYLHPDNMTVAMVLSDHENNAHVDQDEVARRARSAFDDVAREQSSFSLEPDAAGAVRYAFDDGLVVIVQPDDTAPMFAVRATVLGGLMAEDATTNGAGNLIAQLLTSGTTGRTASALAAEVDGMAASLAGFSGRNTIGLRMTALSRDFERAMGVFTDALLQSTFPQAELDRVKRETLADIAAQRDNLGGSAFRLFNERAFHGHPYAQTVLGTPTSVAGLGRSELLEYYQRTVQPSRMVIAVVGDVDPQRVLRSVAALVRPTSPAAPRSLPVPEQPSGENLPAVVVDHRDRQQAHLVVGYQTESLRGPNRYALEVLGAIAGGQGGRLFVELRDKQSLAYSVNAYASCGYDAGTFAFYIATSPQKVEAALQGIREQAARLRDEGVTEEELRRAQRFLVGRRDIGLQRHSARAGFYAFDELYGAGYDAGYSVAAQIEAVTLDDVQRAATLYLRPEREIVAIVGPVTAEAVSPPR